MATVLIVDDSTAHLYSLSKLIEVNGHQVITAQSGQEGVDKAVQNHPDVILMDIVMPGMSGFQATRALSKQQQTSNIPVIFVTTKNQETDKIWGMRQGATAYITKPVDEKALMNAINTAIAA